MNTTTDILNLGYLDQNFHISPSGTATSSLGRPLAPPAGANPSSNGISGRLPLRIRAMHCSERFGRRVLPRKPQLPPAVVDMMTVYFDVHPQSDTVTCPVRPITTASSVHTRSRVP